MGRIVISNNITLDGVVEDPAGDEGLAGGGWVGSIAQYPQLAQLALDDALGVEALLLGRRSYEWFGSRWPSRTGELADRLNGLPKHVVSSSPLGDSSWANATVLAGDPGAAIAELRARTPGDLLVIGSIQLAHTLLDLDLADELRLKVFPTVVGNGRRLYGELRSPRAMRLAEHEVVDGGITYVRYERARS